MSQRMVHYLGGPADGYVELMEKEHQPFMVSMTTDTDGYYAMDYEVAGRQIGKLQLTDDDVIARWHQRSSAHDFMTGDTVIVKSTSDRATVLATTSRINPNGTINEGWTIVVGSKAIFVTKDEIRIATSSESTDIRRQGQP